MLSVFWWYWGANLSVFRVTLEVIYTGHSDEESSFNAYSVNKCYLFFTLSVYMHIRKGAKVHRIACELTPMRPIGIVDIDFCHCAPSEKL